MAKLSLRHIYKVYPNGVKAVNDFNMEIADKEFIVFVGPSGCGKSTTLRMIAGLEDITAGEFYIGDELCNDMEPKDRDIAMVFQNYALYPHMTVYDNMAFGLKLRHVPRAEIHEKVLWAADVLKITEYLDRKPRALSGGQRQRVALGRAILREPKAFLLDEPLSNLDAKLRTEMRAQIAKLHQQLNTTFIYVTHDQVEAMTLGTRVVVMKLGVVQQIDTPQNLYDYPENKFVAGFIGTPQMNFFEGTLKRNGDDVFIKFDYCENEVHVPFNDLLKVRPSYLNGEQHVWIGLRCEDISLDPEIVKKSHNLVNIKVSHFEELGNETLVYGDLNMQGDGFIETSTRVIVKSYHGALHLKPGDVVQAALNMKKAHFFNKEDEMTILPRVPKENVFDCLIKNNEIELLGQKIKLPKAIQVEDMDNVELFIPVDAINFDGNLKAKVTNIEVINDTKLYYLEAHNRVFFIKTNKILNVGDEVNLGIDFKQISIRKDNVEVVKPLSTHNVFIGAFSNASNDKKAVKSLIKYNEKILEEKINTIRHEMNVELGKLGFSNELYKEYKAEYKAAIIHNRDDYNYLLATSGLSKEGKKKAKADLKEANAKSLAIYQEKKAKLYDLALNKENEQNISLAEEIKTKYNDHIFAINDMFEAKKRSLLSGEEANLPLIKQEEKELVIEAKNKISALKEDMALLSEEEKASSKIKYEKQIDDIMFDSKLFYLNIDGVYLKSTPEINKKIIQALGTDVFRTNYRYEIDHYSYKITDGDGLKVEVFDIIDYGKEKFLKCKYFDRFIYVFADKDYKVGEQINLAYDLGNIRIYENKFDIRLY